MSKKKTALAKRAAVLFGLFWFAGSAVVGLLYDKIGPLAVAVFSVAVQLGALITFLTVFRKEKRERTTDKHR